MKIIISTILIFISTLINSSEIDYDKYSFDIGQTVYKVKVNEGVQVQDVQMAILSHASDLNIKFVSHQPLSSELNERGVKSGQVDIYQFCNPEDARRMIDQNIIFVAYMPCRIAMVEDDNGDLWLMMLDLDLIINNSILSPETKALAEVIVSKLKTIIEKARVGDF